MGKLIDYVNILDSQRIPVSSAERATRKKIYPYYGAQGIVDYIDNFIFDGEYILVAEDGENLRSLNQNIATWATGKFWVNNHAHVLGYNGKANLKYIYYLLSSMDLRRFVTGSAQPKLNQYNLANIQIDLPPKETQDKIATLLGALDDKIALNKKINATLEAMAQTVYDYYFLQFDCPDERGKPYKSSGGKMIYSAKLGREIPIGWEVVTLGDIIIERPKSTIQVGDAKNIGGEVPFFTSGDSVLRWTDSLVDDRNIFLNTGGNADVKFYIGQAAYSTDTWCITARDDLADYLYLFLSSIRAELGKKYFQGTGLKHLQKPLLKAHAVTLPPKNIRAEFNKTVQPCFTMISADVRESRRLAELRDWLLPLLLNGQVS